MTTAQLVFPHQLFADHLAADHDMVFVLVEPDLFFRQFAFHVHKLVLHRASMRSFEDRLREAGFSTRYVETSAELTSDDQLAGVLRADEVTDVLVYDLVDNWLDRDLHRSVAGPVSR